MTDSQNEWFAEWFDSPYYHLLYKNRSTEEAGHFVDNIMEVLAPANGDTLLDLACGKGRHAVAFATHGLDVTGVDLSNESIAYARQFEHEKLHFYVHDMRQIFREAYYDVICNLFTSFGYFKNDDDHLSAAGSIFSGLKDNGKFLIDFVNRDHAVRNIEQNRQEQIEKENVIFNIERTYTPEKFIKEIRITDGSKKFLFRESVSSFTLQQMRSLFGSAGFTLLRTFGNYEMQPYDENASPRMILLFQK